MPCPLLVLLVFSNRWYADALRTSAQRLLPNRLAVRAITAPYFPRTKIEASRGRGQGDYFASHDPEDLVAVIDGRTSPLQPVQEASPDLRAFSERQFERSLLHLASGTH
jgi:hypothetical protein